MTPRPSSRFGHAWVALTITLAAHVADETVTDFLAVYNLIIRAARARASWLPLTEFTFAPWLAGQVVVVLLLLALSPLAYRRSRGLGLAAYLYATILLLNGIAHLLASVYLGRWAPGATTTPLLIATSVWLLNTAREVRR
jgi:hypothetical protein